MAIENTKVLFGSPSLIGLVSGGVNRPDNRTVADKTAIQPADVVTGESEKVELGSGASAELKAISDDFATHVRDVRQADKVLEQAVEKLSKMKDQLDVIVKNFPPFSPDSKDRVNYLNTFSSLRRQYELLTIPPVESHWPPQFLFDNSMIGEKPVVVELGNGMRSEFPPGLVKTPELPVIPQLDERASDDLVASADRRIGEAYEALVAARQRLRDNFGAELAFRTISGIEGGVSTDGDALSLSTGVKTGLAASSASIA